MKKTIALLLALVTALVLAAGASAHSSAPSLTLNVSPNPALTGGGITGSGKLSKEGHGIKHADVYLTAYAGSGCYYGSSFGQTSDKTGYDGSYSASESIPDDFPTGAYSVQSSSKVDGHWVKSRCVNVEVDAPAPTEPPTEPVTPPTEPVTPIVVIAPQVDRDGACTDTGQFVDLTSDEVESGVWVDPTDGTSHSVAPSPYVIGVGETCDTNGHTFTGILVDSAGLSDDNSAHTHPQYK